MLLGAESFLRLSIAGKKAGRKGKRRGVSEKSY